MPEGPLYTGFQPVGWVPRGDHYTQVSLYSSQLVGSRGVTIIHRFHCIAASWLGPEG